MKHLKNPTTWPFILLSIFSLYFSWDVSILSGIVWFFIWLGIGIGLSKEDGY